MSVIVIRIGTLKLWSLLTTNWKPFKVVGNYKRSTLEEITTFLESSFLRCLENWGQTTTRYLVIVVFWSSLHQQKAIWMEHWCAEMQGCMEIVWTNWPNKSIAISPDRKETSVQRHLLCQDVMICWSGPKLNQVSWSIMVTSNVITWILL